MFPYRHYIANPKDGFKAYWINTSSNDIIKKLIGESETDIKQEFGLLLSGRKIESNIEENIVFSELDSNIKNIFSFLTFSGYLNAEFKETYNNRPVYLLSIPNIEVKIIFEDIINNWVTEKFGNKRLLEMLKALIIGDTKLFEKLLSLFVVETLSYFDTEKRNIEKTYQAFLLGMLINLVPEYNVESEKESGYGRYDISVVPKDRNKTAIIMELKAIDEFDGETKDLALENALKQIEERQYETAIRKRGYTNIKKMAVTFDGKRVWVKTG